MKPSLPAVLCCLLIIPAVALAQSAALSADDASPRVGSVLRLTASIYYAEEPAAMGWSLELPDGWSLVATEGPQRPQVAPGAAATGTLEWAYTNIPADSARFQILVKAAGRAGPVRLHPQVLLRVSGCQKVVAVAPLHLSLAP